LISRIFCGKPVPLLSRALKIDVVVVAPAKIDEMPICSAAYWERTLLGGKVDNACGASDA
jgi:hypothetical protein